MSKVLPKNLIIDVDGVLTDGSYYYTADGKVMKRFGPDDNDALSLLDGKMYIHAITGDKRGYPITKKRVLDDMGLPLDLVSTFNRVAWIEKRFSLKETIYMGDGIFDPLVFEKVLYSIAPANAFFKTKETADFITRAKGGEGAVAEAVLHILTYFFNTPFTYHELNISKGAGAWKKK
jgi:3-deoxy-D-manno-octulosonate 8-phosphate phosphatase (KDO 8-P phosphatase)